MNSVTSERFKKAYVHLPEHIQEQTKKAYRIWQKFPHHPSLQFKQIHKSKPIYSVRVSLSYRAIGIREKNEMIWFWIGSHSDYDKMIASLQKRRR